VIAGLLVPNFNDYATLPRIDIEHIGFKDISDLLSNKILAFLFGDLFSSLDGPRAAKGRASITANSFLICESP
jgi:hypothetical protein